MAAEPEVSIINIYGVPETITPILTPTPTYVLYGLHYDSADNCWKAQIDTGFSESSITYTISATGYNSETISIPKEAATSFEVTLTPTKTKPEYLYAYTNVSGKTLYAWTTVDSTAQSAGLPFTFYTTNPDPSALSDQFGGSNLVFDENGNDITSTFLYGGSAHFSQADTSTVTWTTYDPI